VIYQILVPILRKRRRRRICTSCRTSAEIEAIDSGGHMRRLSLRGLIGLLDMETQRTRRSIWEVCIELSPGLLSETKSRRAGGLQRD
jgi:hypothetical protein